MKLPRLHLPVLTKAEKTALVVLTLVLGSGAALRTWEHSGVKIGPVKDWDTLRKLVVQARLDAGSDTLFPCFEPPPMTSGEHWPHRSQDSIDETGGSRNALALSRSRSSSKKNPPGAPLDLNTANATSLQQIPKVGPAMAAAIVSYRTAHGRFRRIEDLLDVKGVGPKKFATLKKFFRVGTNP